jgi:hypothetical protein
MMRGKQRQLSHKKAVRHILYLKNNKRALLGTFLIISFTSANDAMAFCSRISLSPIHSANKSASALKPGTKSNSTHLRTLERTKRRKGQVITRSTESILGFDLPAPMLGFLCVMFVWGIPQTIGMQSLDKREECARKQLRMWGIETEQKGKKDYLYKNAYGQVAKRFKEECEKRGETPEKYY